MSCKRLPFELVLFFMIETAIFRDTGNSGDNSDHECHRARKRVNPVEEHAAWSELTSEEVDRSEVRYSQKSRVFLTKIHKIRPTYYVG